MPARPPSRSRTAGIVGPLAAIFAVTFLCGTTTEEAQLFAKRRQRIAGMTHAEVEQLKRNYEEFRKLSPERRKALEELDAEVRQDSSGHLLKLLTGYNRWLSGLSPFDQDRVLSKTDPIERAQLVKTIREEQKKRQALAAIDATGRPAAMLQPADLDAMLKAVEDNFLTPESRKKIPDQLARRERHLRTLKAAQLQVRASDDPAAAAQTLISALIEAVPNEAIKNRIMNPPRARSRRQVLGQVLSRSLVNEWWDEIRAVFPTQEAIDAEVTRRLAQATSAARRDALKNQLGSRPGRRAVGSQLALATSDQFKELRPVAGWLAGGLPAKLGSSGTQPAVIQDDTRTDEAENKTKSAD
jgi:hypothetical protein